MITFVKEHFTDRHQMAAFSESQQLNPEHGRDTHGVSLKSGSTEPLPHEVTQQLESLSLSKAPEDIYSVITKVTDVQRSHVDPDSTSGRLVDRNRPASRSKQTRQSQVEATHPQGRTYASHPDNQAIPPKPSAYL